MREVQIHVRSMAGRALGIRMRSVMRARVATVAGLALLGIAPLCAARNLTAILADERAAQSRVPATPSKTSPDKKPQGSELQETTARPESVAAAPQQVKTKPPDVTYQDGELTIVAENASISEVLAAVRATTGADIELPPGMAEQRIWVRLGPGPARGVLRDLLDGTELNYVIQASESDSEGIRSVSLTVRNKSAEGSGTGTQVAQLPRRNAQPSSSSPAEAPEQEAFAPVAALPPAPAAPPETPSTSLGAQSAAINLPVIPANADSGLSRPAAGASDQMIQQLQSMYEQRRQLQLQVQQNQNQNQKP